jgi:hypothetical protein
MRLLLAAVLIAVPVSAADTPAISPALKAALANRLAGEPTRCIGRTSRMKSRIIDTSVISFMSSSSTLYVNTPDHCGVLKPRRQLVMDARSNQICEGDEVGVADLATDVEYGSCRLGPFVPWVRAKR